jgi:hypothetical protein
MTQDQLNKINMFQATNLVLNEPRFHLIWSEIPAFVKAQVALSGSINLLGILAGSQGKSIEGFSPDHERLRLSLVSRMYAVAEAANLTSILGVKIGELIKMRDFLLNQAAQMVHEEASTLFATDAARLSKSGLSLDDLSNLRSAITAYVAVIGPPSRQIADAVRFEIQHADSILVTHLDRLILQFVVTHSDFISAYADARRIGGRDAADLELASDDSSRLL